MHPHRMNVEALCETIKEDCKRTSRYPVRFILIKGLNQWQAAIEALKVEVAHVICLSTLCKDADTFPFLSFAEIKGLVEGDASSRTLLIPVSECIRLNNSNTGLLASLAQWELVGNKRVYVPLLNASDFLESELRTLPRYQDCELPDVWRTEGTGDVEVQVAPFYLQALSFTICDGIKAYLRVWEEGGASHIHLITQFAPHLRPLAGNFDIKVHANGFEFLRSRPQGLGLLRQEWGTDEQWKWLAQQAYPPEDFTRLCHRLLNIRGFDPTQLLSQWHSFDPNRQWVCWLLAKSNSKESPYLQNAINATSWFSQFPEYLVNGVFSDTCSLEDCVARKNYLKALNLKVLPHSFWSCFANLNDPLKKLRCLTELTDRERKESALVVKELLVAGRDFDEWWPSLEVSFSSLANYLRGVPCGDEFIQKYFSYYTRSKVSDEPAAQLLEMAREAAANKYVWNLSSREKLLEEKVTKGCRVLWVDGMGLEWLGLLTHLCVDRQLHAEVHIGRASLPTVTACNKGWDGEEDVIRGLDQIAHRYDYRFPDSLIEQMDLIDKVLYRVEELLGSHEAVFVTSDHGLSRTIFHKEPVPVPDGAEIHHWGRYVRLASAYDSSLSDLSCLIEGNNVFLAVHGKFKGGGAATGEIHGGATLEEILVPIIRISKSATDDALSATAVQFDLLSPLVKLDVNGNGQLMVQLKGQVHELNLRIGVEIMPAIRGEGDVWEIRLTSLRSGKYTGRLVYEGGLIGDITFETVKGIKEEDLGL